MSDVKNYLIVTFFLKGGSSFEVRVPDCGVEIQSFKSKITNLKWSVEKNESYPNFLQFIDVDEIAAVLYRDEE